MGGRGSSLKQRQKSIKKGDDYSKPLASEELPKLEGSDKQIEWANKIRQRYIDSYNWSIEHSENDPLYQRYGSLVSNRVHRLMQEGVISPEEKRAGSTHGLERVSTSWAKNLQIVKMPTFEWDEHDDLTKTMNRYRQDAIDSWVQHTKGESKDHADMMNAREKAINKFYDTANKELTSKIKIMDDDALDKMTDKQYDKAYESNMNAYYKFLRKYSGKALKNNTDAGWWIDNFK